MSRVKTRWVFDPNAVVLAGCHMSTEPNKLCPNAEVIEWLTSHAGRQSRWFSDRRSANWAFTPLGSSPAAGALIWIRNKKVRLLFKLTWGGS